MRRLRHRVPWASAALAAGVCMTAAAEAEVSPPVDLQWEAPQGCPSKNDVERDVARTIGGRAVGRDPLHVRVDVWRSEAGGWKGNIQLSAGGQATRRQVYGGTCEAVESAVAIVVGLAAVHDAVPSSAASPVEPPPSATAAPPSDAPPAPPPVPFPISPAVTLVPSRATALPGVATSGPPRPPAPRRFATFLAGASALFDVGSLPSATPGVEIFAGWRPAWWQLEVTGAYLAPSFVSLDAAKPAQGANVWLADVGARACGAWSVAVFQLGPCVGANASWIHATGEGSDTRSSETGNTANASLGARASWNMTRWAAVHLAATLMIPLDRATVTIRGAETYTTAGAAFRGAVGAELHF